MSLQSGPGRLLGLSGRRAAQRRTFARIPTPPLVVVRTMSVSNEPPGGAFRQETIMDARCSLATLWLLALNFGPASAAQGSFSEDAVLVGSDTGALDALGRAVALDGDSALVGSVSISIPDGGSAYFFRRVGDTWIEESKVTSPLLGACIFGMTVAMNGNRAVVGDWARDFSGFCSGRGALTPFADDDGGWIEQNSLLGPSGVLSYGSSIAMRGDVMVPSP